MVEQEQDGLIRNWYATCGAEIKAWFAAVLVWCMCKTLSFEQFYQQSIDPGLVKKWFPSWKRFAAIKRFLKLSDPEKDNENRHNRMYKVAELFDFFIAACKANKYYWPFECIALDEAVKKIKG